MNKVTLEVPQCVSGVGQKVTPLSCSMKGESIFACRQLEAIVRIAESLAKMKLQPFASEADVEEALRLFQVSTLDAAMSGSLSGEGQMLCPVGGRDMLGKER